MENSHTTIKQYFEDINLSVLPSNVADYIRTNIISDPDSLSMTTDDEYFIEIKDFIEQNYPSALVKEAPIVKEEPAPAPAMTVEEEIKSVERKIRVYTLKMRNASADEKASIERKIRVYKLKLRGLENKKEKGGAVILTGTQSAGDPTSNMGETVATVDYSVGDPEQMADGSELKHENAKEKAVKAIWHGRKSLKVYIDGGYKSPLDLYERNLLSRANRMLNKITLRDSTEISEYEYSLVQDLEFITREVINTDGNSIPMDRQKLVDVIDEAKHYFSDKHYEDGGEINHKESLLNFVQNHLSAGYVGSRLHDLGYHEGLKYNTIDKVRSTMIEILIEHGDKIYSISSLNKLIADAAYNIFGKAPNQETAHYRKTHHFNEGGEMDSPEFAKAHREYEAFVANELPPHIGDNVDTRGWVLEDRSGNTDKTEKELERLKKRAKSYNERFDVIITEDDKNYYLRTREKESYDGEIRVFGHGGGFEKLAHHVTHEYEGTKVPAKYQKVYHEKRYSHESAEEVGRKVAAKVYREQQSHQ
jgi:hypothetical protein